MKTVIEMVRAAGFPKWDDHEAVTVDMYERLVELIRADEREAIDQLVNDDKDLSDSDAIRISKAIRARSNK